MRAGGLRVCAGKNRSQESEVRSQNFLFRNEYEVGGGGEKGGVGSCGTRSLPGRGKRDARTGFLATPKAGFGAKEAGARLGLGG